MSGGVVVRDRELAVKLLAGSLYDFLPGPKGATFNKGAGKNQSATHLEPCLPCGGAWHVVERTGEKVGYAKGTGVKKDRFKREVPCEACGGYENEDGTITAGKGVVAIDRMTNRQVGTESTYAPPAKDRWACNVCLPLGSPKDVKRGTGWDPKRKESCRACDGTGTREVSRGVLRDVKQAELVDVTLSAVERGIEIRDSLGSYHELEVCLAELARREKHRHDVFHRVYVVKSASAGLLSETEFASLRGALARLLEPGWMPRDIRVPREVVEGAKLDGTIYAAAKGSRADTKAQERRDEAIRERREAGASIKDLMADFNLGKSQVYEIVAEVEAA